MEASTVFKEVLNKVETSQLNYVISKTPFSANIVIKSSFIKYHDAQSSKEPRKDESEIKPSFENLKYSSDLLKLKEQNMKLEDLLQIEKKKVKSLEDQIGEFRENLLDIKKDKHDLNAKIVYNNYQLSDLTAEQIKISEAKKDLKTQIVLKNEKLNEKDYEIKVIEKENEKPKSKLDQCLSEIESFKLETMKNQVKFKCTTCNITYESGVELNQHVRNNHVKHQVS